ncbi:hypothetical protein OSB04_009119, partial [Centaurea solstitialis]
MKCVTIDTYFIKTKVENSTISLNFVPSKQQETDMFTKASMKSYFERNVSKLGMWDTVIENGSSFDNWKTNPMVHYQLMSPTSPSLGKYTTIEELEEDRVSGHNLQFSRQDISELCRQAPQGIIQPQTSPINLLFGQPIALNRLWGATEWYQSRSLYHRDGGGSNDRCAPVRTAVRRTCRRTTRNSPENRRISDFEKRLYWILDPHHFGVEIEEKSDKDDDDDGGLSGTALGTTKT